MESSQEPPPVSPKPPDAERPEAEHRKLRVWLAVVSVVALAAVGLAGYALSEATKEEKPDDTPIRTLRSDFGALERAVESRASVLERRFDEQVGEREVEPIAQSVRDLEERVKELEQTVRRDDTDDLVTRIDELEQRIDDAENDGGRP